MKCLILYYSRHKFKSQQIYNFYINKKSNGKIENIKTWCYNPSGGFWFLIL